MQNFEEKQKTYLNMELLRFTTAGSVDDGKSTLIGRLLYDSKAIFDDQLQAIENVSIRKGEDQLDLALLTDGLRAEREQGITIDVAYRFFATPKRKFIIADTPGHIQYTRNMVTGASTANAAIVLIDARHGVIEQTLRHSYIASLLRIPQLIICVNKMDLVDYSQDTFEKIKGQFLSFKDKFTFRDIYFVPISAKLGDNVVDVSAKMDWYKGPSLLNLLETIPVDGIEDMKDARFPVQYVIRPQNGEYKDYRGYAGRVAGGVFKKNDPVIIFPSKLKSHIKTIDIFEQSLQESFAPQSVTLTLTDNIDVSRGNLIVKEENLPQEGQNIDLMVCWLNQKPLVKGKKYWVKHYTNDVRCIVQNIEYKVDINTLENNLEDTAIQLNDIAKISIKTTQPLFYDSYSRNRVTGSLILIDEGTNETVGAGMII
ncbi:MAG: GTP-binding protein [Bacteroidota bacterium]|nr:GTP-binding protein [Bacteroidota bacterium]MDP4225716.1 GTP-binding protein [Bacteroidota bacterium]